jgi:hypothetical protein
LQKAIQFGILRFATKSESENIGSSERLKFNPQELNLNSPCLKFNVVLKSVNLGVKLSNLNFLASWSRYSLLLESLTFYSVKRLNFISQTIQTLEQSILAALLVEGLLIVFAFLKPSNLVSQILVKTVLALLFLYSSWSFSSNVIGKGMGNIAQGEVLRETISGLKATMVKNDLAIEVFMQKGWLSAARKLTNENNEHRKRLLELQAQEMNQSLRPEGAQKSNTISLVVLRFLFQISNIILVHQLSSGFQRQFRSRRRTMVWRREMDFAAA